MLAAPGAAPSAPTPVAQKGDGRGGRGSVSATSSIAFDDGSACDLSVRGRAGRRLSTVARPQWSMDPRGTTRLHRAMVVVQHACLGSRRPSCGPGLELCPPNTCRAGGGGRGSRGQFVAQVRVRVHWTQWPRGRGNRTRSTTVQYPTCTLGSVSARTPPTTHHLLKFWPGWSWAIHQYIARGTKFS